MRQHMNTLHYITIESNMTDCHNIYKISTETPEPGTKVNCPDCPKSVHTLMRSSIFKLRGSKILTQRKDCKDGRVKGWRNLSPFLLQRVKVMKKNISALVSHSCTLFSFHVALMLILKKFLRALSLSLHPFSLCLFFLLFNLNIFTSATRGKKKTAEERKEIKKCFRNDERKYLKKNYYTYKKEKVKIKKYEREKKRELLLKNNIFLVK